MLNKGIMVYCIQETWIVGNSSNLVRDHILFRHNREEREIGSKGRILGGVAIVLALAAVQAWKKSGSKTPITTPRDSSFIGQFIGVKLCFPRLDLYDRTIHGHITLFVASVYHLLDKVEHANFTDTLSSIMTSLLKSAEFIGVHDVNANLGIRNKMYRKTLGPWGIDNRNMKSRRLLVFFVQHRLKVTNSF